MHAPKRQEGKKQEESGLPSIIFCPGERSLTDTQGTIHWPYMCVHTHVRVV